MTINSERIGSFCFLGLGVAYVAVATRLPTESPNLSDVGPRIYPLVLGALFLGLAATWAVSAFKVSTKESEDDADVDAAHKASLSARRVSSLILAGALYLGILDRVGFTVSTMLFLFTSILIVSWIRPTRSSLLLGLGVATVGAIALKWLLGDVMAIHLP